MYKNTFPRLRRLLAGPSLRRLGFSPKSVHVEFWQEALGQVFSPTTSLLSCQYNPSDGPHSYCLPLPPRLYDLRNWQRRSTAHLRSFTATDNLYSTHSNQLFSSGGNTSDLYSLGASTEHLLSWCFSWCSSVPPANVWTVPQLGYERLLPNPLHFSTRTIIQLYAGYMWNPWTEFKSEFFTSK